MNIHSRTMRELGIAVSLGAVLVVGLPLAHAEGASGHKGMHGTMQQHGAHQGGMQKGKHGMSHHAGGKRGGHGKAQAGHHLFGDHWKKTLTAEQKVQLDRVHLQFAKKKHALGSGIRALQVQLAIMAVADQPQSQAIDARLDELLMAKRQLMQAKYSYIAAQRKVLTPEQRVSFDMDVIHKAGAGKTKAHRKSERH